MTIITVGSHLNTRFETELEPHDKVRFHFQLAKNYYLDISIDEESGELEIYANDGQLLAYSKSLNLMRVRHEPHWDDKTIIQVAASKIRKMLDKEQNNPQDLAEATFDIIRGRQT